MTDANWTAADVDLTLPSSARLYDYSSEPERSITLAAVA
jgi:hypothetical protein